MKPAKLPRRMRNIYALEDLEPAARRFLPKPIFGYIAGGAETARSLRENRSVFDEISFVPRSLIDVSQRKLDCTLMGKRYALPFGIAPMGISALSAYKGDLVQARAAMAARVPMIMSGSSLIPLETVAKAAPGTWFQAYLPSERDDIDGLIDRVGRAGVETLVITIDTAVLGSRETNLRNRFKTPLQPDLRLLWDGITHPHWALGTFMRTFLDGVPHFENSYAHRGAPLLSKRAMRDHSGRERQSWEIIRHIRSIWPGTLVIKEILHSGDVELARAESIDGIILSNHGGRQLDGAISPMRVLPEAVEAAGGMAVMIDSGFRRGTDILKALALGASFCFVGRPFNYAAALGGEAGVGHAIGLLETQLRINLGLLGLNGLHELDASLLDLSRFARWRRAS